MTTRGDSSASTQPTTMPDLVSTTTGRVEQVLKATEEGAAGILDDARAQARRYVIEVRERLDDLSRGRIERINELTESLVAQGEALKDQAAAQGEALKDQAAALRSQSDSLTEAIAQVARALETELGVVETPDRSMPEGYCVKERKKVEISNPEQVTMKNGRPAIKGECPDCGAKMFKIGKLEAATSSQQAKEGFFQRLLKPEEGLGRDQPGVEPSRLPDRSKKRMKGDGRGVSVIATQLRQAGLSETEIQQRLSDDFGVPDVTEELLDPRH